MQLGSIDQAYRDSHSNTNEEHICTKADGYETLVITKLIIDSVCNCTSQPEGKSHTRRSNAECYPPILDQQAQIHLESYKEEEEDQTDVGGGVECSHGGGGEDGIGETWGTAED